MRDGGKKEGRYDWWTGGGGGRVRKVSGEKYTKEKSKRKKEDYLDAVEDERRDREMEGRK